MQQFLESNVRNSQRSLLPILVNYVTINNRIIGGFLEVNTNVKVAM
jgi:hypothetical protein